MSAWHRRGVLAALAGALTGCAAPEPPQGSVRMAPGVVLRLPEPKALGRNVEAAQLVRARYGPQDFLFEAHLSVTPERLLLAGLDPLGRQALMLRWADGRLAVQAADWLPAALRPENMLADIMLLYWPEASVRGGLEASGAVLTTGLGWRTVRVGQAEVIRADYASDTPWNGALHYRNLAWGYALDVQSVEMSP